jgi:KUP system potassium uptake protein
VVLAVTGAEALYADMGHFGRPALRRAWFSLVFPALLINYFGQGALLLRDPSAAINPFYRLVPAWGLYPMVALASIATIIASQAVISGAFSLTRQAVQLGYLPRLEIRHTSAQEMGQIYVPFINYFLLAAVLALVLGFKSSDNLGAAYGIAVTGTMSLTTVLAYIYMHGVLRWNTFICVVLFGFFMIVDLAFFGANLLKIVEGGWFPLVVAAAVFAVMTSWIRGRNAIVAKRTQDAMPIELFLKTLRPERMASVPGTAVFMTANVDQVPRAMLHNLKHNKVLHQNIVLMKVLTEDIPRVEPEHRLDMRDLGHNFHALTAHYGFMEEPNIPRALGQCETMGLRFNMMETSIFVGREKIVAAKVSSLSRWRRTLFILMSNLMVNATDFFGIPINRVVELGGQIEI